MCRTEYRTECTTRQELHQVEEDVVECHTVQQEQCEDVVEGHQTVRACESWPVERCSVSRGVVGRHQPRTSCHRLPTQLCSPRGCGLREGPLTCQQERRTVVTDSPVETCHLEPQQTCRQVTRLTPSLHPTSHCLEVPREVCATDRVNPRTVKRPTVRKWCFNQKIWPGYNQL